MSDLKPYISLPFSRPSKDGLTTNMVLRFDGNFPQPGTYWKIERERSYHHNRGIRDQNVFDKSRMRLRFYSEYVDGSSPVPIEWIEADGVTIKASRDKSRAVQYAYDIEPLPVRGEKICQK